MTLRRVQVAENGRSWDRLVPDGQPAPKPARAPQPLPTIRPPCRFEGEVSQACPRGDECLHVRHCLSDAPDWSRCTRGSNSRRDADIGSCATCSHYAATIGTESRRHLVYHLYPGPRWRQRVDAIVSHWSLFTGRVHVAAALDSKTPTLAEVKAAFPADADVFEVRNDPKDTGRERVSWQPLWDRVLSHATDGDVILRAHSKCTSLWRQGNPALVWWTEILESLCLDRWPLVEAALQSHPIVGPFKTPYGWNGGHWHYSGSWYWVRAGEVRARGTVAPANTWGVEVWPGLAFQPHEAGEIGPSIPGGRHLYDRASWVGTPTAILPQYREWQRSQLSATA